MTVTPCCGCARNGGDPRRPGKKADEPDALRQAGRAPGGSAWPLALAWASQAGMSSAQPSRSVVSEAASTSRAVAPDLSAPRVHRCARHRVSGERRFARHYVHAGMIGWDGTRCQRAAATSCWRVGAARRTLEPSAVRLGLLFATLPSRTVLSQQVLDEATARRTVTIAPHLPPVRPQLTPMLGSLPGRRSSIRPKRPHWMAGPMWSTAATMPGRRSWWRRATMPCSGWDPAGAAVRFRP